LKIGIQKFKLVERKNKKMLSTIRKYAFYSVEGLIRAYFHHQKVLFLSIAPQPAKHRIKIIWRKII